MLESLKIERKDGSIFYVASVPHNPGPVEFKLIELSEKHVVFENPEHDFPQRISYTLNANGTLDARVEGTIETGEQRQIDFHYMPVE